MDRLGPPPAAPIIHRPVIDQQSEPRPLAPAHAAAGLDIFQPQSTLGGSFSILFKIRSEDAWQPERIRTKSLALTASAL